DLERNRHIATFAPNCGKVQAITFSPDGKLIAAGCYGNVSFYDWQSKTPRSDLKSLNGYVFSLAFLGNSEKAIGMIHGGSSYSIFVAPAPASPPLISQPPNADRNIFYVGNSVLGVAHAPNGRMTAVASRDGGTMLFDPGTGKRLRAFSRPGHDAYAVGFTPDSEILITGESDYKIVVRDIGSGQIKSLLTGHKVRPVGLAVSSNGSRLASGDHDGHLMVWDLQSGATTPLASVKAHGKSVFAVAISPKSRIIATSGAEEYQSGKGHVGHSIKLWAMPGP
ncbi:MAG TPA: hypothetical protein PK264_07485, partial [Hyphomicrobiaceae bacterium]|nr:hypothetical protein [Hyphomicrobiaceae bacterium]